MRFKKIYIEITNSCNLQCSFCIQNDRLAKIMSVEQFAHIIQEIKPYTSYVYLHILGEPLSHPKLKEILAICEKEQIHVNMTTNGTLLYNKKEDLYHSKIRQVNISLHSFKEHKHISLEDYLHQVFEVSEHLAAQGTYISYRLWNMKNKQLDEETKGLLKKIQERYKIEVTDDAIVARGSIALQEHMYVQFEEVFQWPSLSNPYVSNEGRCLGLKTMCGILSDGRVVPCCLDSKGDVTLGNIFTTSFKEILENTKTRKMQEGFMQGQVVEELCQHCSYRLRFLGEIK